MSSATSFDWPEGRRWQGWFLIAGIAGMVLCGIGAIFDPEQFFRSYLLGFLCWLSIALGSWAIWMIHQLTGGVWGLVIRRLLEAAARTLPLMLILFVPIAAGLHWIYPWTDAEEARAMGSRADYLNERFFLVRAGVYFAIWLTITFLLGRWSSAQDRAGDAAAAAGRSENLSGPGLVLYGLTVTFASIDWVMSLQPDWSSTIFGALVAMGQFLPALALAIAVASLLPRQSPLTELATIPVWNDLGNLLLAFVMLWTYMAFSQFLLIWCGNLPEEITWYLNRGEGGWQWIEYALGALFFALPFLLLLSRDVKRHPHRLRWVALGLVGMSFVSEYWLIAPNFSPKHLFLHWMDLAAIIGVGGLWLSYYLYQIQSRPLLPLHDPLLVETLRHA